MNKLPTLLMLLCILHANFSLAAEREWTSDVGTKVQAELISYSHGMVTLKAADGRIIELSLDRLSGADQAVVADWNINQKSNSESRKQLHKEGNPDPSLLANSLALISLIIMFISSLALIILAFRTSFLWGLGYVLIPFVSIIFIWKHWADTKKSFMYFLLSIAMGAIALAIEGRLI